MKKRRKKKKAILALYSVLKMCILFLLVLIVAYFLVNYVFRRTIVRNVSMQNTLYDGDNIIMDEIPSHLDNINRYDVICFKSYSEKNLLIKRVIGLPGETIRIFNGIMYINDEEIKDIKGLEKPLDAGIAEKSITLDDDEYFVLGDNRPESTDSRSLDVGNIRKKDIIGIAKFVFYPFNHIKVIK